MASGAPRATRTTGARPTGKILSGHFADRHQMLASNLLLLLLNRLGVPTILDGRDCTEVNSRI
jgi:hypothetical protein